MLPPKPFWFLRHGQTDYNARGLSQGAVDIPLNDTGREQARAIAPLLAGRGITSIAASPMLRARETATIINETLAVPLSFEPDLREVVFGGMEGKPLMPWFADWLEGRLTPEGAESFPDITRRAEAVMARVLAQPGLILVVSHGAFFRAVRDLMALERDVPAGNARPIFCEPVGQRWRATALD